MGQKTAVPWGQKAAILSSAKFFKILKVLKWRYDEAELNKNLFISINLILKL